jgi:hypothetical protein
MKIFQGSNVGISAYGSTLYQLSRKFAVGSRSAPSLAELELAANGVPDAFSVGTIHPDRDAYDDINAPLPATYLGGMPFTCTGVSAAELGDRCLYGMPTWPNWVPETYDASTTASKDHFLEALETERPGRSDRVALTYAGWAAHMIQDAAQPHHAALWTGEAHRAIDENPDGFVHRTGSFKHCGADTYWKEYVDTVRQPTSSGAASQRVQTTGCLR